MHDPIFLAGKSKIATKEDLQVAQDLFDTLMAHKESCVGMAANTIGVRKCIIAFPNESGRVPIYTVMLKSRDHKEERCIRHRGRYLSLLGVPRKCKRYKNHQCAVSDLGNASTHKNLHQLDGTDHSA